MSIISTYQPTMLHRSRFKICKSTCDWNRRRESEQLSWNLLFLCYVHSTQHTAQLTSSAQYYSLVQVQRNKMSYHNHKVIGTFDSSQYLDSLWLSQYLPERPEAFENDFRTLQIHFQSLDPLPRRDSLLQRKVAEQSKNTMDKFSNSLMSISSGLVFETYFLPQ